MTTFDEFVAAMLATHRNFADLEFTKRGVVTALANVSAIRSQWGEGQVDFVLEPGVVDYPFGYPRLPEGIMSLSGEVLVTSAESPNAILQPSVLVSSNNLTGDITALQDSAQNPDENDLRPTTADTADFVVRWDQVLSRPLIPGLHEGQGSQDMRVSMFNKGNPDTVNWEVKEGAVSVATGSILVTGSTRRPYDIRWDAAFLSTMTPASGQITLTVTDSTGHGDISYSAIQWFPRSRDDRLTLGGQYTLLRKNVGRVLRNLGGRLEIVRGFPREVAVFNNALKFYPAPAGSYLCTFPYQKDAARDSVTNEKITIASSTETSDWFDAGFNQLRDEFLIEYYALRPQDAQAMQMAMLAVKRNQDRIALNYEIGVHDKAVESWL